MTALHHACKRSGQIVSLLLLNGADKAMTDAHGRTALHIAVKSVSKLVSSPRVLYCCLFVLAGITWWK